MLTIDEQVVIFLRWVNLEGILPESVGGIQSCFWCQNEDSPMIWLGRILSGECGSLLQVVVLATQRTVTV